MQQYIKEYIVLGELPALAGKCQLILANTSFGYDVFIGSKETRFQSVYLETKPMTVQEFMQNPTFEGRGWKYRDGKIYVSTLSLSNPTKYLFPPCKFPFSKYSGIFRWVFRHKEQYQGGYAIIPDDSILKASYWIFTSTLLKFFSRQRISEVVNLSVVDLEYNGETNKVLKIEDDYSVWLEWQNNNKIEHIFKFQKRRGGLYSKKYVLLHGTKYTIRDTDVVSMVDFY